MLHLQSAAIKTEARIAFISNIWLKRTVRLGKINYMERGRGAFPVASSRSQ